MNKEEAEKEVDQLIADLTIDPNELDSEWIRQAKLFFGAALKVADTKADLEEEKNALAITHAEIGNNIRLDPEAYHIVKPTEKAVEASILETDIYQEALKKVNTARHVADIASAFCNALDHKKRGLENLVKLHGQSYFATPRADENSHEVVEEIERNAARNKVRRRRKNL